MLGLCVRHMLITRGGINTACTRIQHGMHLVLTRHALGFNSVCILDRMQHGRGCRRRSQLFEVGPLVLVGFAEGQGCWVGCRSPVLAGGCVEPRPPVFVLGQPLVPIFLPLAQDA